MSSHPYLHGFIVLSIYINYEVDLTPEKREVGYFHICYAITVLSSISLGYIYVIASEGHSSIRSLMLLPHNSTYSYYESKKNQLKKHPDQFQLGFILSRRQTNFKFSTAVGSYLDVMGSQDP